MNQVIPANLIELGPKPQTPQERAKAKRLYKAYRWTWAMYWALGVKQGWACGICGRIATGGHSTLNVDHQHFHIRSHRLGPASPALCLEGLKWRATVDEFPEIELFGMTKKGVEAEIRKIALPLSVRGLLCPGRHGKAGHGCCNRLLGRVDNPDWLEKARNYLLNPPAKDLTKT